MRQAGGSGKGSRGAAAHWPLAQCQPPSIHLRGWLLCGRTPRLLTSTGRGGRGRLGSARDGQNAGRTLIAVGAVARCARGWGRDSTLARAQGGEQNHNTTRASLRAGSTSHFGAGGGSGRCRGAGAPAPARSCVSNHISIPWVHMTPPTPCRLRRPITACHRRSTKLNAIRAWVLVWNATNSFSHSAVLLPSPSPPALLQVPCRER